MTILHIRQDAPRDGKYPIRLTLRREGQPDLEAEASIEFALTGQEQEDIRWYLEDYLERAEAVEDVAIEHYTTPSTPVDIRYRLRLEETEDLVRDYVLNPWDIDPSDDDLDTIGILAFGIDSQDGEASLRDLDEDYQPGE